MKGKKVLKGRKGQKGRGDAYDISFRRKVAMEYNNGDQSIKQLGIKYNISYNSVSRWAKAFSIELAPQTGTGSMTEQEERDKKELEKQVDALKQKLEYEQMKNYALETMIDLAKEELGVDLRKNSGAKQPEE